MAAEMHIRVGNNLFLTLQMLDKIGILMHNI